MVSDTEPPVAASRLPTQVQQGDVLRVGSASQLVWENTTQPPRKSHPGPEEGCIQGAKARPPDVAVLPAQAEQPLGDKGSPRDRQGCSHSLYRDSHGDEEVFFEGAMWGVGLVRGRCGGSGGGEEGRRGWLVVVKAWVGIARGMGDDGESRGSCSCW